jgi:hypothetical protein
MEKAYSMHDISKAYIILSGRTFRKEIISIPKHR